MRGDALPFTPDAERVRRLDHRMRERLADSLSYVGEELAGHMTLPANFTSVVEGLRLHPIHPQAFAIYTEIVLAAEAGQLGTVRDLIGELVDLPSVSKGPRIVDLDDFGHSLLADRYRRFVDTDPTIDFRLLPPPADDAATARTLIAEALVLLDSGAPALSDEIRALLREIVLAIGPDEDDAMVFDGASAFLLWGSIVLNAQGQETRLDMAQALAHESAHNLLFGLSVDGPLVENADDECFASPLRDDPRPMDGIYHATFVVARMHYAVAELLRSEVLTPEEAQEAGRLLDGHRRHFSDGLDTVERYGRLTPTGADIIGAARDYMAAA